MQNKRKETALLAVKERIILTFALCIFYLAIRSFGKYMPLTYYQFEEKPR